jgi:hypothetical protein
MTRLHAFLLCLAVGGWGAFASSGARAQGPAVALTANPANPASPHMGDNISFKSVIRNDGNAPLRGIVAWLGLVETDKGNEQPVDLEDWSAQRVVTADELKPGQSLSGPSG